MPGLRGVIRRVPLLVAMLATILSAASAAAQFPDRPVRVIVPFAPGGVPDIFARLLAQHAAGPLGQPVVVENRPGAGGNIGVVTGMRAAPDGHTVTMCAFGCATNPHMYQPRPFNPLADLAPVMLVGTLPNVLVVHPSVEARTPAELVALARREPGRLTFASSGAGSSGHLSGELLRRVGGVELLHVPFRGQGEAVPALLSGTVLMFFDGIPSSLPHIQRGALRALATTGPERSPALPDVPTMREAGFADFVVTPWMGLVVPAATPAAPVARLNAAFNAAMVVPEVRSRFEALGTVPGGGTPERFAAFLKEEVERWGAVIRAANIRVE
jgi:tripartite-type tricarboxylate transporter receptor subunit TctC